MGTCLLNADHCSITEEGVRQISTIDQLEELVLGKSSGYSDEPAAKTEAAFKAILKNMENLKQLEMWQPDLQQLNICTQRVIQGGSELEMYVASYSLRICLGLPFSTSVISSLTQLTTT
jgi:hypothetical protein